MREVPLTYYVSPEGFLDEVKDNVHNNICLLSFSVLGFCVWLFVDFAMYDRLT